MSTNAQGHCSIHGPHFGFSCPSCNASSAHLPVQTDPIRNAALARISAALERIAAALEAGAS